MSEPDERQLFQSSTIPHVAGATAAGSVATMTGTVSTGTYSGGEVLQAISYPMNAAADFFGQLPIHDFMQPESLSDKGALAVTTVSLMGYGIDQGARYVRRRYFEDAPPHPPPHSGRAATHRDAEEGSGGGGGAEGGA